MCGFKRIVDGDEYPDWDQLKSTNRVFYCEVITTISKNPNTTAKQVHDLWIDYAKMVTPDHPSIVPFSDLSTDEKIKDALVISSVKMLLEYFPLTID